MEFVQQNQRQKLQATDQEQRYLEKAQSFVKTLHEERRDKQKIIVSLRTESEQKQAHINKLMQNVSSAQNRIESISQVNKKNSC